MLWCLYIKAPFPMASDAISSKAFVLLLLLLFCRLLLLPLYLGRVWTLIYNVVFCVLCSFANILLDHKSSGERGSWLLYFDFVFAVVWLFVFSVSSSWYCWLVIVTLPCLTHFLLISKWQFYSALLVLLNTPSIPQMCHYNIIWL